MKKWIAAILTLVMLTQALPWTAFADAIAADKMITDSELARALQIAGLRATTVADVSEKPVSSGKVLMAAGSNSAAIRVEAQESGYHSGMKPDETWDAQMLMDWLDDKLSRDIYNVTNVYARAEAILDRLKDSDPSAYARYTENADFVDTCHKWAIDAEFAEEEARLLHQRLGEYTVVIENNTEMLANGSDSLFDYEKARYSEQIREAAETLEKLRENILTFSIAQVLIIMTGQAMIDGTIEPEFSAWLKEVLSAEEDPAEATVSSASLMSPGFNTRASRLAASGRVLTEGAQDVSVQVISENDFAIIVRGVNNQFVGGVKVTVSDLNGNAVKTLTTDSKYGSVIFNANDFVCDYDKEMEISIEADASGQGYRSFYIPWTTIKRGGTRTETLTLLTGPETRTLAAPGNAGEKQSRALMAASSGDVKPYIYSCIFNGYDIMRQDKTTSISSANDAQLTFEVEVDHAAKATPKAPELHCYVNLYGETVQKTFTPTSTKKVSSTRRKYIYKGTWRKDLAPEITVDEKDPSRDQKPYFVLPDTGEVLKTKLTPVRSKTDKPIITGQEPKNPLNSVLEKGFGLDFTIPKIGGKLSLSLPIDKYLPKVACDPSGYVTITFGSSLVTNPNDGSLWKNKEAEKQDKEMKDFQHAMSITKKKQALGTAKKYYKSITDKSAIQTRVKFDVGYFVMFAGRGERGNDDGGSLWSVSGAAGGEVVLSADYTQQIQIGPVPLYLNINFAVSCGLSFDGMFFTFGFDRNADLQYFDWSLVRGITVNIRLALTVSLGIGIKGIASVWVSATGALNIIVSFMSGQPEHIAVYLEASVSVGFEIFWIKYSRVIWDLSPKIRIYANYDIDAKARFSLFTAYADAASPEEVPLNQLEPERYPQLAPEAKKVISDETNAKADIKAASLSGHTFVFYIGQSTDDDGRTSRNINYIDATTGQKGSLIRFIQEQDFSKMDEYAFDVMSDGTYLVVVACCADAFDGNGYPKGNTMFTDHSYCYGLMFSYEEGEGLDLAMDLKLYAAKAAQYSDGYNVLFNPRISEISMINDDGDVRAFFAGSFDAMYDATGEMGSVHFQFANNKLHLLSDVTVKNALGDGYERFDVRNTISRDDVLKPGNHSSTGYVQSAGFVALSKPKNGANGKRAIEFYDYYMNVAPVTTKMDWSDRSNPIRIISNSQRRAIALTTGEIDHMEMTVRTNSNGETDLWTVFYTQTETSGERTVNRLKSLEFQPRTVMGVDNFKYNVTYKDYDISIPDADFRIVTIGGSRYLYWLSTVSKEKKSDPDIWRVTGVYYDAATGTMSDQIVIAEFTLPDSRWNGRNYKSVPYDITLTGNGMGYITAKPNTGETNASAVVPMTLYSFPITLKPVATLKGASLMETTVCQGEMVATDLTVMNEGNMGIGSFDVELWLMENGREKQKIETLHADCLHPANSTLTMHTGGRNQTVAYGEAAFYRLKDFIYSPRQSEWIVKSESKTLSIKSGTNVSTAAGSGSSNRTATNVIVPGALGGFTGSIKIPSDWKGEKHLRLKLTRESTYSNWLAASALARTNPELFAEASTQTRGLYAASEADANARTLAEMGIVKLDYALNDESGKLVLQNPKALAAASASRRFAAGEGDEADETVRLYATEIEAPEPVDINCDVHDLDVSHRLYDDYYGDDMLEITLSNYYTNDESVRLTCAMYLDGSKTPEYVSLPYDPDAMAAGKTTTITVPLSALFDPETVQTARFVFSAPGIAETASFNNEFTIYPGGSSDLSFEQDIQAKIKRGDEVITCTETIPAKPGDAVAMHADVTGGTTPYRYQWQVYDSAVGDWVNLKDGEGISGAKTDTLTLQSVKTAWNGRKARCVVSDAAGATIASKAITLRVSDHGHPDTGDHASLPLYLTIALIALALLMLLHRRERDRH